MKKYLFLPLSFLLIILNSLSFSQQATQPDEQEYERVVLNEGPIDKKYADLMAGAESAMKAGNFQQALDDYLNPIISAFEEKYKDTEYKLFAAYSPSESLLYTMEDLLSAGVIKENEEPESKNSMRVSFLWAQAYFYKGNVSISLGNITEGEVWLERAVELSPYNAGFINELAYVYLSRNDFEEALNLYEKAEGHATLVPENERNYVIGVSIRGAGYALIELNRLDEAEKKYDRALEIDPMDMKARNELQYIKNMPEKSN